MGKVDCPACGGTGWLVPGARAGHWAGLLPWPADLVAEPCELCDGSGEVEAKAEPTTPDISVGMREVAEALGQAIGLTFDPGAEPGEQWVASVGLDAYGAGPDPVSAINDALGEWYTTAGASALVG